MIRLLERALFRVLSGQASKAVAQSDLHYLGNMQRPAIGGLGDLLPATESVGDDDRVLSRLAHLRQQHALADLYGNIVVPLFKSEGAGHAAATRVEQLVVQPERIQQLLL